jgi:hypothetical protein
MSLFILQIGSINTVYIRYSLSYSSLSLSWSFQIKNRIISTIMLSMIDKDYKILHPLFFFIVSLLPGLWSVVVQIIYNIL